jgi:hypothetical protein
MREAWKILVIVALFVAVVVVLAGKRNRASTVSVPWSPAPLGSQAHAARPKALPQLTEGGAMSWFAADVMLRRPSTKEWWTSC